MRLLLIIIRRAQFATVAILAAHFNEHDDHTDRNHQRGPASLTCEFCEALAIEGGTAVETSQAHRHGEVPVADPSLDRSLR